MSNKNKYCHCDECEEKEHCRCDTECPDPSPCGCGECDELRSEFADCSPHYFHIEGDEPNFFTQITLFRRLASRTVAFDFAPFVGTIQFWANKFQVDGEFLCPFLAWARNNSGQLVLVRLAPGTPKPVKVIEPPSPECKAYVVFITSTISPTLTNSTRGTNPFNRNSNLSRRKNIR